MTAAVPTIRTTADLELDTVTVYCPLADVGNFSDAFTGRPGFDPVSEAVHAVVGASERGGAAQMKAEAVHTIVSLAVGEMANGAAVEALVVSAPAADTMAPRYTSPAMADGARRRHSKRDSRVMAREPPWV